MCAFLLDSCDKAPDADLCPTRSPVGATLWADLVGFGSKDASACHADCHTFKYVVTRFHRDQTNRRSRANLR
jgi:ethanolamine utilization microcompartment shell protein EutL